MKLESRKIKVLIKVGCKSRAVTCNASEDIEYGNYPNLSKNMIKIKCSSVFLSSFVNTVG